jgi:hypothetical protein
MSARLPNAPDELDGGSWATETLPMSVRRELLERELNKLGFRKAGQGGGAHPGGSVQQQQQPQGDEHPQAADEPGTHSQ